MLLSGFASPRRLALLGVVFFVVAILFLHTTSYSEYLPKYELPGFSSTQGEGKSSLEEDQQAPGNVETHTDKSSVSHATTSANTARPTISSASPTVSNSTSKRPTSTAPEFEIKTGDGYGFRVYQDDFTASDAAVTENPTSTTAVETGLPTLEPNGSVVSIVDTTQHDHGHGFAQYMTYDQIQANIQALVKSWLPSPQEGHMPPYEDYRDKDYDPNLWEGFQWDNAYYLRNGVQKLQSDHPEARPEHYLPYPEQVSPDWKQQWHGEYVPCEGARGRLLNDSAEDVAMPWLVVPNGFSNATLGSADALRLDDVHCFDRYNRFGPYGYGQGERGEVQGWQRPVVKPDWTGVNWGRLQDQCLESNKERYAPSARQAADLTPGDARPDGSQASPKPSPRRSSTRNGVDAQLSGSKRAGLAKKQYHPRTAVLVRTRQGYEYTENDLQNLRAMVTELSLLSGGEYHVFLLVAVGDENANIFGNQQVYNDVLRDSVPRELQGIALLWNEALLQQWYPDVGDWSVFWHQYMPVQWFSETHPEFDFVWHWEADTRYTGNHYTFLESLATYAKEVPRKYLWERNQRFYIPSAGSFADFVRDTVETVETGVREGTVTPVWGPQPFSPTEDKPVGPAPPTTEKEDNFSWGKGEDADLITLAPIFDPSNTKWEHRDMIWNYVPGMHPLAINTGGDLDRSFHYPEYTNVPRRASLSPTLRFSKRQLHAMHLENSAGRALASEMMPASVALQHGLKAVYAPHPVWADRKWLAWYGDAVFNSNSNKTAQWGQQADSVYNPDRSHNFGGLSYATGSGFPTVLYRRWLGFAAYEDEPVSPIDGLGGAGYEDRGFIVDLGSGKGGELVGGKGRMCLPSMLLHPVNKVRELDEPPERPFMEPGG